jgi:hypothetical protein
MGQFPKALQETVMTSTATKFVGRVSEDDAKDLAKAMSTEPESFKMLQKTQTEAQFLTYVRDLSPQPGLFSVPLGQLENSPRMTEEEQEELITANRARYCAPYDPNLLIGSHALAHAGIQFELDAPKAL